MKTKRTILVVLTVALGLGLNAQGILSIAKKGNSYKVMNTSYSCSPTSYRSGGFVYFVKGMTKFLPATENDNNAAGTRTEKKLSKITNRIAESIRFQPMEIHNESTNDDYLNSLEIITAKIAESIKYQPAISL